MRAHVIEAVEQSRRLTIPTVNPLISLEALLKTWPADRILLFGDETLTAPPLAPDPSHSYGFLVGPEGGFSAREFALLRAHPQAKGVTLSPHILRAETAALAGLACLASRLLL